jgi:hypothetical protein
MFRSLFQDHLQGSSFALSAYHASAAPFVVCLYWYVVVCPIFVCVSGVPSCLLSGRDDQRHTRICNWRGVCGSDMELARCLWLGYVTGEASVARLWNWRGVCGSHMELARCLWHGCVTGEVFVARLCNWRGVCGSDM